MPSIVPLPGRTPLRVVPASGGRLHLTVAIGAHAMAACSHAAVFWLVLRGRVAVRSKEGDFALGPGEWIALDGDSAPQIGSRDGALLLGVGLEPDLKRRLAGVLLFPARGSMPVHARGRALRLWQAHGAFDERCRADDDAIGTVVEFLAGLQVDLVDAIDRCPGRSERRRRQVMSHMQRARLCLEGRTDGGLRIGELAKRIHFSPWYFSKVFVALYGIGPLQFSVRMRLERAHLMLSTTCLPVTEVSAVCGFDNPCSFARAFRAHFGMSASEYRLRNARGEVHRQGDPDAAFPSAAFAPARARR